MRLIARVTAAALFAIVSASAVAQTIAPSGPNFQPNTPLGQQIGVTNLPAPVILQSQPTAKLPLGDYAGEVLQWVVATFGTTIGAALTALLVKMLKNAGVQGSEQLRSKLDDIIVNGLNLAAKEVSTNLQGKASVEVKNEVVARAVQYAQVHGADTLKQLGDDPSSASAVEAIKARIETAINDPSQPTPPVLDGAKPTAVVAATVKPAT